MTNNKYIFITGTSSGLGFALTEELSRNGYQVIAGVRKEGDFTKFNHPNIHAIICDVANQNDINTAYEKVIAITKDDGLFTLINNAGVNYISPFELANAEKEKELFEINLMGPIKLTRALLPLLHKQVAQTKQKAKIINVSSIGGIFGLPWESTYHASKFGLFGWSQSIRYELEGLNIDVCCFLPGGMKTDIFRKSNLSNINYGNNPHKDFYQRNVQHMNATMKGFDKSAAPANKAAKTIHRLLQKEKMPLKKYFGMDAGFIKTLNWLGLIDLLKGQFIKN